MSEFLQTQAWIVERVGWVLIHSAWQIAVVGILTWLVVSFQRRSAARLKYAVLLSGLVTMLILPAITAIVLRDDRPHAVVSLSGVRAETQANVIEITSNDAPSLALQQNSWIAGGNLVVDNITLSEESELQTAQPVNMEALRSPETAEGIRFETILQPWLPTIVAWWLAGLLMFALRPLFGWVVVQRLRRQGTAPVTNEVAEMFCRIAGTFQLASSVQLLQSALVTAPVLVGWMRPVILLPVAAVNGLTLSQLEAVLAHELAHVRRFDSYVVVLQTFFEALFFFHPVAWWISNQIRHEREFCCDDLAISVLNNRVEYGRALLAVSELKGSHGLFVLGADGGSLIFRVQRLFGPVDTARSPIWASATAMILMLAVSLFWFAHNPKSAVAWTEPNVSVKDQTNSDVEVPVLILRGKAVMPDGSLAKNAVIEQVAGDDSTDVTGSTIKDGQFEIRTMGPQLNAPSALIRTPNGSHMATVVTQGYTLRSDCSIERLVTLEPTKTVQVKVTREGQAVSNAKVELIAQRGFFGTTNSDGVAEIQIPTTHSVYQIVAWTEDRFLGGIIVARGPTLNSSANNFEVKVSKSRKIRLRAVDPAQKPVPNLPVRFFEMSGEHFEFTVGTAPFSRQTTSEAGEAIFELPDRLDTGGNTHRYVDLPASGEWSASEDITESEDGILLLHVKRKRSRVPVRATLSENIAGTPGMLVELHSFQGEDKDRSDVIYARTDDTGSFQASVLAGSTYVAFVNDREFVSNIWHGQIADAETSRVLTPELRISKGVAVNVHVTEGDGHTPAANMWVNLETPYRYEYEQADGSKGKGNTGRRFWGQTDKNGQFTGRVIPGILEVQVYESDWKETRSITVPEHGPVTVEMHRPFAEKVTLKGRLQLPAGETGTLVGTSIRIVALDSNARHEAIAVSDAEGTFTAAIAAGRVALVATSPSDQFFGCTFVNLTSERIDVPMFRTVPFSGHLLGDYDAPQQGVEVTMYARRTDRYAEYPQGTADSDKKIVKTSRATVKTDGAGYFEFPRTPVNMELLVEVARRGESDPLWFGKRWIEPGENRPTEIIRIGSPTPATNKSLKPLETVMADALRDCRLSHTHALFAVSGPGDEVVPFLTKSVFNADEPREVYSYLPTRIDGPRASATADRRLFFEVRDWPFPAENSIFLTAIDPEGGELGRITININDKAAALAEVSDFLTKHVPQKLNAEEQFEAALAEAQKSNRRVWACVSQTRCAPCFALARWMDSQRALLEKDYVLFKFDDVRDIDGAELRRSLGFGSHGVPCHAILDAEGKELVNSIGPLGNIGCPDGSFEGAKHLRRMLTASRQQLTDAEINSIILSLPNE